MADPIDANDANDPALANEAKEAALPTERTESWEQIDRTEFSDRIDHTRESVALADGTHAKLWGFRGHVVLNRGALLAAPMSTMFRRTT